MKQILAIALVLVVALGHPALSADPKGEFEVHDLSIWVVDVNSPLANVRTAFPSALPPQAVSPRSRTNTAAGGVSALAPLGLIRFYGRPTSELDVDLRIKNGTFLAHWPSTETPAGRLRWSGNPACDLVEKIEDESSLAFVDPDHLFRKARQGQALFIHRGARSDRFLAYDAEMNLGNVIRLQGGPDKYTVVNVSDETLHDVLISRSTPEGRQFAWIDALPKGQATKPAETGDAAKPGADLFSSDGATVKKENAPPAATKKPVARNLLTDFIDTVVREKKKSAAAKRETATKQEVAAPAAENKSLLPTFPATKSGVEVTFSEPLAAGSPEATAKTTQELTARLQRAGLSAEEAELFSATYAKALFESDALLVACRLDPAAIETRLPLSVLPEPAKTVRVAMVVVRNADPQFGGDIDRLVKELGDPKYKIREAAQTRLLELGPLAFPALNKGLTNSDLEIVMRCEKILVNQNQTPGASTAPAPVRRVNGVVVPAPVAR